MIIPTIALSFLSLVVAQLEEVDKTSSLKSIYSVEGRVTAPDADSSESFYQNTRVIVNYGEFLGFIRFVLLSVFIHLQLTSFVLPDLMDHFQ